MYVPIKKKENKEISARSTHMAVATCNICPACLSQSETLSLPYLIAHFVCSRNTANYTVGYIHISHTNAEQPATWRIRSI